jgi:hypothetical protein
MTFTYSFLTCLFFYCIIQQWLLVCPSHLTSWTAWNHFMTYCSLHYRCLSYEEYWDIHQWISMEVVSFAGLSWETFQEFLTCHYFEKETFKGVSIEMSLDLCWNWMNAIVYNDLNGCVRVLYYYHFDWEDVQEWWLGFYYENVTSWLSFFIYYLFLIANLNEFV